MRCHEVRPLLGRWYDGELEQPVAGRIADHLRICAACSAEIAGWRRIDELLCVDSIDTDPARLASEVLSRVARKSAAGWGWWLRAAAALVAALGLGIVAGRELSESGRPPAPRTESPMAVLESLDTDFGPRSLRGMDDLAAELASQRRGVRP